MTREREALLAHLDAEREHVVSAVTGLEEADLTRPITPSGWSVAELLHHLAYDDEIFWLGAVVAGDEECVALVQDGWRVPVTSGADALATYQRWTARARDLLADVDLDDPPRWWPPEEVFPFPPFESTRSCVLRVLVETATHAGHLDIVREQLDGHQHLVVG